MITGIIIALPDELSSLTSKKIKKGECITLNEKTLLTLSGTGPKNAEKASQLLLDHGANRLISWGCAAALTPHLKPGDLILANQVLSADSQILSVASSWLQQTTALLNALNPISGLLAESHTIVAKSSAKQAIHQQSSAIALDMESTAIVKTAQKNECPVLIIRCIADPVSMSLPKAVSHALNNEGDVLLPKLLGYLCTHPSELPNLIKLGLHFSAAKNKLKLVAKHLDIIVGFEQQTATQ